MRLGNITSSRDAAMPEMWPESRDLSHVTDALLTRAFGSFLGSYEQVCDSVKLGVRCFEIKYILYQHAHVCIIYIYIYIYIYYTYIHIDIIFPY